LEKAESAEMLLAWKTSDVWKFGRRRTGSVWRFIVQLRSFPTKRSLGWPARYDGAAFRSRLTAPKVAADSGDLDLRRFLYIALGSASELDCELLLARDLGFLMQGSHEKLFNELRSIKAMLSTFIRKIGTDNPP